MKSEGDGEGEGNGEVVKEEKEEEVEEEVNDPKESIFLQTASFLLDVHALKVKDKEK